MTWTECLKDSDGGDNIVIRRLDGIEQNIFMYGGASCKKIGITLEDGNYLLKFPGSLRGKELTNVARSYSNEPVCEYIGSHIYELLNIPAHKTLLTLRNNKLVVLCKDFTESNKTLAEFSKIKITFEETLLDANGNETDGTGSMLNEALTVIRNHPIFKNLPQTEDYFWTMFIIDALIGNPDRNNGNWGVLLEKSSVTLAPVYDNGNCLNDKWDDEKMKRFLDDEKMLINEAYKGKVCFFTNEKGNKINPFQIISSNHYPKCTSVLRALVPRINRMDYNELIDSVDVLTETQNKFYKIILSMRIQEINRICQQVSKLVDSNLFKLQ